MLALRLIIAVFILSSGLAKASEALETQIHALVMKAHNKRQFHGNIQVKLGDEVLYQNSLGIAVDEFDVPHSERSRFMIASISKQFTAAAIMQLQEQGKLSIDDTISKYISLSKKARPETTEAWSQVTIRQLLTHTAGTIRDVRQTDFYSNENYNPFVSSIVRDMSREFDLFTGDRDSYAKYSNLGYMILANIIQEASGFDYHDYLNANIFAPLGMKSTGQYHRMFNIKHFAPGYNYTDGVEELRKRCCFDASSFVGSHSLYSDVADIMIWLDDLHSGHSKVLSQASIQEMTTGFADFKTGDEQYGFGLMIDEVAGAKRVWHDGFEYGYLSMASSVPEVGLKIVILGNRHDSSVSFNEFYTQELNDEISELVLESLQ